MLDKFVKAKGGDITGTIKRVPITPELRAKWDEVRTNLLWFCPAFSHVLYTMMNKGNEKDMAIFVAEDDKVVQTAATDGNNLFFNVKWFMERTVAQGTFVTAHEIMHAIWNHCGMSHIWQQLGTIHFEGNDLKYDHDLMGKAMDYVINAALSEAKIGEFVPGGCLDPQFASGEDSVVEVYAKLHKEGQGGGKSAGGGSDGKRKDGASQDVLLAPGTGENKNPEEAMADRRENDWQQALNDGLVAAKAQGRLPANIERLLREIMTPVVPWQDKIVGFFNRHTGSGSYNFRKPDRRLIVRDIYAPSRTGHNAGTVVVGLDTSGSIFYDGDQLERFLSEVGGILEDVNPMRLVVLHCDAYVHKVEDVDSLHDLQIMKPHGGGGTSFVPVFEWIEEELDGECDALVYLTDGYGSFPREAPNYPVLWGDCTHNPDMYPFGEVVEIPK